MCRYNLHETYRHIPRVRASSSSGRPIDGPRRIADGNCSNPGRSAGLPVSVESPSTAPRRAERPSASGSSRAPESGPESSVSRLAQGATAYGWSNNLWTAVRVTEMIQRHFGLSYHPEHVRKIVKQRLGWTSQQIHHRARERDEKKIDAWRDHHIERIQKKSGTAKGPSRLRR